MTKSDSSMRFGGTRIFTRTVITLGLVSLFTDAASDMIWPLLPAFLATIGGSAADVGLIEGIAETTAALCKYWAGRQSDRFVRKKPLVVAGYGLSSLVRPLLALATSPLHALAVRFADRVGKGVRSAPRDALLASATPPRGRAAAFGFHRTMDNLGAVIGPLLASAVLWWRPHDLRMVFVLSAVPGALAVLALVLFVPEAPRTAVPASSSVQTLSDGADTGPALRRYLAIVGIFALANASDFFLLAKAQQVGVPVKALPLIWGGLSLLRALAATPGGVVADRIGRTRALTLGWTIYAGVYAAMGFARSPLAVVALVALYGAYYGLTEGAERALVASFAPRESLGRAYGAFALINGLAALPASALFGLLWRFGQGRVSFLTSAALAALAALLIAREARGARGTPAH